MNLQQYSELETQEQRDFLRAVHFPLDFQPNCRGADGILPRVYSHEWDVAARVVFPARVRVGLTDRELEAATQINPDHDIRPERLRPVHHCDIGLMIVAEKPVLAPFYERFVTGKYGDVYSRCHPVKVSFREAEILP